MRAEQRESSYDANTRNHRQYDDEKHFDVDDRKFFGHSCKPMKRLFEKFHDYPPFRYRCARR